MFERLRFARYALRFERAFKSDNWEPVRSCFDPSATYTIVGGDKYDGVVRGRDEIMAFFRRMLNELDRKFDRRIPGLSGFPRVSNGEFSAPWRVRYILGTDSVVLTGLSRCKFKHGRIIELRDTLLVEEVKATLELLRRSDRSATPS